MGKPADASVLILLFLVVCKFSNHFSLSNTNPSIVHIPKIGKDPSEPTNNRGITLMSVISKIYDSILFKRHEKRFKRVVCETQSGM